MVYPRHRPFPAPGCRTVIISDVISALVYGSSYISDIGRYSGEGHTWIRAAQVPQFGKGVALMLRPVPRRLNPIPCDL